MDPQRKSVLDYARSHGVAFDFAAVNLIKYVDQTCDILSPALPSQQETQRAFEEHLSSIHTSIEESIRTEKLDISKDDALFLSAVIQKSRAQRTDSNINWDSILPSLDRYERIKLEVPLLKTDAELSFPFLRQRTVLDLREIQLPTEHVMPDCQDTLSDITDGIKKERLECTKESLKLIQNARRSCELPHGGLERLSEGYLRAGRALIKSPERVSPLLPFNFCNASDTSSSARHMLPSPLSSAPSEKQKVQPREITTRRRPSQFRRYSNVRERVWLLDSSEIDDMGSAFSMPGEETSQPAWNDDTVDTSRLFGHEDLSRYEALFGNREPSSLEDYLGEEFVREAYLEDEEASGTTTGDIVSDGGLGLENEQEVSPAALPEGHRPEHMQGVRSRAGHSHGSFSAASQDEERSLQNNREPDSQYLPGSPMEDTKYSGLAEQRQPQHGAFSESRAMSEAESSFNSRLIVESVETDDMHQGFTAQESQQESLRMPEVKREESSAPEWPADYAWTMMTPRDEAEAPRDPASLEGKEPSSVKRKRKSSEACQRKQPKTEEERAEGPTGAAQNESADATSFKPLGSLSSFMDTRGIAPQPQTVERSPYFGESGPTDNGSHKPSRDTSMREETPEDEEPIAIAQQIPQCHQDSQDPLILFLYMGLLKTHVPLVKYLEKHEKAPAIIYRNYGHPQEEADARTNSTSPGQKTPVEADIIISPTTGIILTTSQETTQLFLPGQKPNNLANELLCIDSPLRMRIFLLLPRYEHLYVLVSHNMDQRQGGGNGSGSANKPWKPTIDKRTLAAITSLSAFCASASVYATVTPLLIPSTPGTVGEWILNLANKHAFTPSGFGPYADGRPRPGNRAGLRIVPSAATAEKASNWELFLRQAGMNPFAALTTLSIMRKVEKDELKANGQVTSEFVYTNGHQRRVRSLSKFLEMDKEHRKRLVEGVVGPRVLKRVLKVLEQDWQCDWALNFPEDDE